MSRTEAARPRSCLLTVALSLAVSVVFATTSTPTFAKQGPDPLAPVSRLERLKAALERADRIVIRSQHRPWSEEEIAEAEANEDYRGPIAAEISGRSEVESLLRSIEVNESARWFHCFCSGDAELEFFAGAECLGSLTEHHTTSLRWSGDEWPGDVYLTGPSQERFAEWLHSRGFSETLARYREERRLEEGARQRREAFLAEFPSEFRQELERLAGGPAIGEREAHAILNAAAAEPVDCVRAFLRGFAGSKKNLGVRPALRLGVPLVEAGAAEGGRNCSRAREVSCSIALWRDSPRLSTWARRSSPGRPTRCVDHASRSTCPVVRRSGARGGGVSNSRTIRGAAE